MTLEDKLLVDNESTDGVFNCSVVDCTFTGPAFAFHVMDDDAVICSNCLLDENRNLLIETETIEKQRVEQEEPWNTELAKAVKLERNRLINESIWATDSATTPLSEDSRAEFCAYIQALHRITIDFACPADVVWPTLPVPQY